MCRRGGSLPRERLPASRAPGGGRSAPGRAAGPRPPPCGGRGGRRRGAAATREREREKGLYKPHVERRRRCRGRLYIIFWVLFLQQRAISTALGTVAATCEVERTTPHGPACVSDGPRHTYYDCPKACGSHADIWGTQDMVRCTYSEWCRRPTGAPPLHVFLHQFRPSASTSPLDMGFVKPLQLYSLYSTLQLYSSIHCVYRLVYTL